MHKLSETTERKFVKSYNLTDLEILTDTGWCDVTSIHQTIPYEIWEVITENEKSLQCADTHILFNHNTDEVFAKDLIPGSSRVLTIDGIELVKSVKKLNMSDTMYDISVNSPNNRYYTNGFLSHNTTIMTALSYVLYGEALGRIKKDNLINKINSKDMLVTLDFENNGIQYKIERGRKPNVLRFFANGKEFGAAATDEAQGDNKETQREIERTLGMSADLFKHLVVLNTEVQPFLTLSANEQRNIIEELLGITKLSEKADKLRELVKQTKEEIKEEDWRIRAAHENNKKIEDNIKSIELKSTAWNKAHDAKIVDLYTSLETLSGVDIDAEIAAHANNQLHSKTQIEYNALKADLTRAENQLKSAIKSKDELVRKNESLSESTCPSCNQEIDAEVHAKLHSEFELLIQNYAAEIESKTAQVKELTQKINNMTTVSLQSVVYSSLDEAYQHRTKLDNLQSRLEHEASQENPYVEQIENLKKTALQEVSYDTLNALTLKQDHQDFLLKLLTNKDSFIRKKIIDHNLMYLNNRMGYYLDKMGLPHEVKFKSDLEVEISQYGKDYDFANLSRGEKTRLILSLSWAFRDVFESLNDRVNIIMVDELIDNGLDTNGVESALSILKGMVRDSGRTCYLISHRDELVGRVDEILKVTKENGFTTFSTEDTNVT